MAQELRSFQVTIPAGTLQSSGFTSSLAMPPRVVERIQVRVPPGPRGQVGFQIGTGGNQVLPLNVGQFIVTDDEEIDWPLENQLDSGAWQLLGYNLGRYDHTLYVRFLVSYSASSVAAAGPAMIPPGQLPAQDAAPAPAAGPVALPAAPAPPASTLPPG